MKREGYTVCVTAQNKVVIYGGKDQNGFCNNYLVLIVKTGRDGNHSFYDKSNIEKAPT